MVVHINFWGVLLSGVASMVIGMIYYADGVFGKEWKKLVKIDVKKFHKEMPKVMAGLFLAALVTAFAVAYVTFLYHHFFQDSWIGAGLATSLILWLGVSATTIFIHGSVEQRPRVLTVIQIGNRLLSMLAMGLIIGWLHP